MIPKSLLLVWSLIGFAVGDIDLGSMESWGFNGVSSDDITLLSDKKMKIKNLEYTGSGPAAWFMVGKDDDDYNREFTDLNGVIIPDENGGCDRLGRYSGDDITLTLPKDMKFSDYDYLSIYCIRFSHNFGFVTIPNNISFPTEPPATVAPATAAVVAPVVVPAEIPIAAAPVVVATAAPVVEVVEAATAAPVVVEAEAEAEAVEAEETDIQEDDDKVLYSRQDVDDDIPGECEQDPEPRQGRRRR